MTGCVYLIVRGVGDFNYLDYFSWAESGGFLIVTILAVADLFGFSPIQRFTLAYPVITHTHYM